MPRLQLKTPTFVTSSSDGAGKQNFYPHRFVTKLFNIGASLSPYYMKQTSSIGKRILQFFATVWRGLKNFFRWYRNLYRGRAWYTKTLLVLITTIVVFILYIIALLTNFLWLFGKSPSLDDIMHPKNAEASELYSADGKLLGKYFNENRTAVPYDSIAPVFFEALISTEDERFYEHHGIDFTAIGAAVKDAALGRARGASTISQQLVKNMFRVRTKYGTGLLGKIPGMNMVIMKSKEMSLAVGIEMMSSKKEILTMYANTVDFGSNAYGIKTAARTYFNTTPAKLTAEQAAVLVGLLKATSAYNPRINPEKSLARRNVVLDNMRIHGHLTAEECRRLQAKPIELDFRVETAYDGTALYFREAVAEWLREKAPELDLYSDGLKIYSTLDSRMQRYAEEAVREQMKVVQRNFNSHWSGHQEVWRNEKGEVIPNFIEGIVRRSDEYKRLAAKYQGDEKAIFAELNRPHSVTLFDYEKGSVTKVMSTMDSIRYMVRFMHTGFVSMEPATGHVKAWVGDIDFKTWKYDKVTAMRQPGSTFKLFVYAAALRKGKLPSDVVQDSYIEMSVYDPKRDTTEIWRPRNADGRYSGRDLPLRTAFARSVNTVAVKLGQEVGIPNVIETAHNMGILSPLDNIPSLPLGSSDVNLFELVNAYGTVANNGTHVAPVLVTKVVDREGNVVFETEPEVKKVLSDDVAFYLQKMLEAGVRDGGGTSQALGAMQYMGSFDRRIDFGGKTGTSNNHSDAWFVGVTPDLVGGAWVGGEYRSIHFRTGALGQGSRTALPIFGLFMKKVLSDPALSSRYLRRYGAPPAGLSPATYENTYQEPARDWNDTLDVDSTALDGAIDLMGTEPAQTEPGNAPQSNAPNSAPGTSAPASPNTSSSKDRTEDLFN